MAKMTLEDLRKLREEKKKAIEKRDVSENNITVIIGMGTCGIAAGAKDSLDAFLDEIDKKNLDHITVRQTGCMGLCYVEPTVEIRAAGMPDTIYGKVDAETARKIVDEHIINKKLVNNHIYDKPSTDIIKG